MRTWIIYLLATIMLLGLAPDAGRCEGAARAKKDGGALSTQEMESHIRFLCDDLLEGRAVGSRGIALAALYHESSFRQP